jgi:hypothetical protein
MHGAIDVQPAPLTHSGAGHVAAGEHAPAAHPTSQRHDVEQSTFGHVPDAAQLKRHAFVPHSNGPVHDGDAAQLTSHAAFAH